MDYEAGELRIEIETNKYYVQDRRRFLAYASMFTEDKDKCFRFAYDMTYGGQGQHRDHRTGGTENRTKGQIFINTFQGKMAEFALYRYFQSRNIEMSIPDTDTLPLGKWDNFDLKGQEKHISVKSTKSYGNLLLLEKDDWNDDGEYCPNCNRNDNGENNPNRNQATSKYNYTVLVRFSPDGEKIMKDNHLLYQRDDEIPDEIEGILVERIRNIEWFYDFPGFIFHSELVKMIRDRHIIPRGALLNGTTTMDAENYYFQAGNMHSLMEIYTINPDTMENHSHDMLKRTCPDCGEQLVIRHGPYGDFWGCTGFSSNGCKHSEPIELRH